MKPIVNITALTLFCGSLQAAWTIPGDGSDNSLVLAENEVREIDLSLAATGAWDDSSPVPGNGIYDPSKWAVVFKYSSIEIGAGAALTFKNHPSHPPVVWLVQGNVVIEGTVSLDSTVPVAGSGALSLTEPGPGAFRGGAARGEGAYLEGSHGLGPGGAAQNNHAGYLNRYGNDRILPLIGGSGAAGTGYHGGPVAGGAGGGAILIASATTIEVRNGGKISADSKHGGKSLYGSGGAVRLIGLQVFGDGEISAVSGYGQGRIRIETNMFGPGLTLSPATAVVTTPDDPPLIWPPPEAPAVRISKITEIGSTEEHPVSQDPTAPLEGPADVPLETGETVDIEIETTHFPTSGIVDLYITEKFGGRIGKPAVLVSGDFQSATWKVTGIALTDGYSVLQDRATGP